MTVETDNPYVEPDATPYDDDPFAIPEFDPHASFHDTAWDAAYNWKPQLYTPGGDDDDQPMRIAGRRSDIAQGIIYHLGRPLRLDNHAFMIPIYNNEEKRIVLKCSRQVAKTTTIAVLQVLESVLRPHWRSLYVSPSQLQTRQYSSEKLRPTIYDSPFIKTHLIGKGNIDQAFEQKLLNGSFMFLRYAFLTAARARGIPASRVFFDECQDLLKDNVKVISQSMSASKLSAGVEGSELLAGTPLTFSNTLEEYWRWSTQCEWLVPCDHHVPRYWNMLTADNIGKVGLICSKKGCGQPINPATGQWVSMAPDEFYQGYHITQLMVPWKQGPDSWRTDIVMPHEKWPESKFNNEILGLSFDSASSPVTRPDIEACCYPQKRSDQFETRSFIYGPWPQMGSLRIFGGVDWGEGRAEGEVRKGSKHFASWTVLTLGAYINNDTFWPFFMKRYTGKDIDPEVIVPDILRICGMFNVSALGADWGHGWGVNSRLFKSLGQQRMMQFAYSSSLGERKRFDPEAYKWIINRNAVLSNMFQAIKNQQFIFPIWAEFETYAKDILAEYTEYNERTRMMKYDHPIDQPDDALHSLTYAKLTADIILGRF